MKKIAPILIILLFTKCSNLKYLNAYDGWKGKPKMVEISYYNVEKEFWYGKQLIYYDSKGRILKQPNINRAGNIVDGEKKFIYDKKEILQSISITEKIALFIEIEPIPITNMGKYQN